MVTAKDDAFYDKGWAGENDWRDMKRVSPMGRHTRRWILKLLGLVDRRCSIADIGCGDGSLLIEISRKYPDSELYGTDFSNKAVEICQKRIPSGRFVTHDIRKPDNPFGAIVDIGINSEVIEHVDDDEAAIRNITSWCRYLILTVPAGRLDYSAQQMGHLRHYREAALCARMEALGLNVLYSRTWGFPMAYPWYARLRNKTGYGTVAGRYGWGKRFSASVLYGLFYVNDMFSGGNKIFMLIHNPKLK